MLCCPCLPGRGASQRSLGRVLFKGVSGSSMFSFATPSSNNSQPVGLSFCLRFSRRITSYEGKPHWSKLCRRATGSAKKAAHTVGRGRSVHLVEGTAPNDTTGAEANGHQQPKKNIPAKPGEETVLKSQEEVLSSHYTCPQPVVRH